MRGRKMKYNRMLCWVRPHEKKELKEAVNGQFPLVFAKNFDDFRNQINEGDYLVLSITKISIGWKKMNDFIENFKNTQFHLLDKNFRKYKANELLFLGIQKNVIMYKYHLRVLIKEFYGESIDFDG